MDGSKCKKSHETVAPIRIFWQCKCLRKRHAAHFLATFLNLIVGVTAMLYPHAAAADGTVFAGQELRRSFSQSIEQIAWSPDQSLIAVSGTSNVYLWDIASDTEVWATKATQTLRVGLAFSPDGRHVIVPTPLTSSKPSEEAHDQQTMLTMLAVDDSEGRKFISDRGFWKGPGGTSDFALANDSSVLIASLGLRSGWLSIYDPKTWEVSGHVGPISINSGRPENPDKLIVDGKRKVVATTYPFGKVQVWDYNANRLLSDFSPYKTEVKSLAFNPVSGELVTGGDGKTTGAGKDDPSTLLRAWDPRTGTLIRTYKDTRYGIASISVSSDGLYIAATEGGPRVGVYLKIWNAVTGVLLKTIDYGKQDGFNPVIFSPNGQQLAVAISNRVYIYTLIHRS